MALRGTEAQARTRLLLMLWDMADTKSEVKKSDLMKRVQRKDEKASDYQPIYTELVEVNAIALSKTTVTLNDKGKQLLVEGLKTLKFDAAIGERTANALLKWMHQNCFTSAPETNGNGKKQGTIHSYEEFKPVALEVYDRLNRDYNLDNLVPIYRIRREIGERVERSAFDNWLLEMQSNDVIQLQGGSLPDGDPSKIEDSVTTELSGLRCYATLL